MENPNNFHSAPKTKRIESQEDYAIHLGLDGVESLNDYIDKSSEASRALGSMALTGTLNSNPSLEEKKRVWKENFSKDKGFNGISDEFLPSTHRQEFIARRINKKEEHGKIISAELSALTTETHKINNITGRSIYRSEEGGLKHLKRSTRRQIKKAERKFKRLKRKSHKH